MAVHDRKELRRLWQASLSALDVERVRVAWLQWRGQDVTQDGWLQQYGHAPWLKYAEGCAVAAEQEKARWEAMLKRPPQSSGEESSSASFVSPGKLLAPFPTLWEFLTLTRWEDGMSRKTGRISFYYEQGRLKMVLADAEGSRVAFLTGETLEALLKAAESGLDGDKLDWRADKYASPGKRK